MLNYLSDGNTFYWKNFFTFLEGVFTLTSYLRETGNSYFKRSTLILMLVLTDGLRASQVITAERHAIHAYCLQMFHCDTNCPPHINPIPNLLIIYELFLAKSRPISPQI